MDDTWGSTMIKKILAKNAENPKEGLSGEGGGLL
jgi:hypothetical protein